MSKVVERAKHSSLLETDELVQSDKRALCFAFLLLFALIAAAILAVLSVPSNGALGPEPDPRLIEQLRTAVALAAVEPERDAPEAGSAIDGPGFSFAYVPTIPPVVQTEHGSQARTSLASSKRMAAQLARHRQRAHAILAHVGERHRRAAVASGGHVLGLSAWNTFL
jgi:hypothetical protein